MSATPDLGRLVPGFDFLQNLMKGAGAAMPGLPGLGAGALPGFSQWVAPTLDPTELDKRIHDLKAVQFWLESNAKLLAATVQALEVQRMTLATLQTMNLPMADLAEALKVKPTHAWGAAPTPEPAPAPQPPAAPPEPPPATAAEAEAPAPAPAAIDPVKWWGALTQQFTDIATQAMADVQGSAAPRAPVKPSPAKKSTARKSPVRKASTAKASAQPAAPAKPRSKAAAAPRRKR